MDLSIFNDIEKEMGLLENQINGFYYWIYGRRLVSEFIQSDSYGQKVVVIHSKTEKLKIALLNLADAISNSIKKYGHRDVLFINNGGRRYYENGYYVDPYVDDLMSLYDSSVMFELCNTRHLKPYRTKCLCYIDIYTLKGYLYYFACKIFFPLRVKHIYDHIYYTIDNALVRIFSEYNVKRCVSRYVANRLTEYYFVWISLKKSYESIIDKISPKSIVEVWHVTLEKMLINEIAKERGIPVIEIQHGNCGKENLAYNYPGGAIVKQFPDYFFSYSEYWTKNARFPIDKKHIIPVGSPYIEKKKKKCLAQKREKKDILVLCDFSNTKLLLDIGQELANSLKEYDVIARLHPLDDKKKINTGKYSVKIISHSEMDLYDIFSTSFCVVCTGSTTALYEGLDCGLDGYVYYPKAMEDFKKLCDENYVYSFCSIAELASLIKKKKEPTKRYNFWLNDSLKKQKQVLDSIVRDDN